MEFSLTEPLVEEIIAAMDNQEIDYVVAAEDSSLIEADDFVKADDEFFYKLPEWKPSDGFAMREAFVTVLHNPIVHDELQNVLHSGRGVFKNFKNVLREYPEIDKRWHIFKHKFMLERITEWYNSLRQVWGLEKLDYFSEADEDLIHNDFSFDVYDAGKYEKDVLLNTRAFLTDENLSLPDEIKSALYETWTNQFTKPDATAQIGFVCYSHADEFAGCITASVFTENQDKVMKLTSIFVPEEFRGLGIGTELIDMLMEKLKSCGKKWIILPNMIIPEFLEPLLIRTGFDKIRNGFVAEI